LSRSINRPPGPQATAVTSSILFANDSTTRGAPQKNPLAILRTAKQLRDDGYDIATVLIGSGPLADKCSRYIDEHDFDSVYMPGFVDDALEFLPDFDVFLLPSRFEGFPLTVLECLHAGVPLVAHDVGGVAEAIDDGKTGFVVSSDADNSRFVDRVETLLKHPEQRQEIGEHAQQVAVERFTEDRMVSDYQRLYNSIL